MKERESHSTKAGEVSRTRPSQHIYTPLLRGKLAGSKTACPCDGGCPRCARTKLTVGRPGDAHEKEADRIADHVMRMPGNETKKERTAPVAHNDSPIRYKGPGMPIDGETKGFMESRFGRDFDSVRIHVGPDASESARALNAYAYTIGSDIIFRESFYSPGSVNGKRLLAHELAHVVQQDRADDTVIRRTIGDGSDLESDCFKGQETLEECYDNEHHMTIDEADGDAVQKIQRALIALGYPLPKSTKYGDVDGIYGGETARKVSLFKADKHVYPADGIVGPKTMAKFDELCKTRNCCPPPGMVPPGGEPPALKQPPPCVDRSLPLSQAQDTATQCWAFALISFMKTRNLPFPSPAETEDRPVNTPRDLLNYFMWEKSGSRKLHPDGTNYLYANESLPPEHVRELLKKMTGSGGYDTLSGAQINRRGGPQYICERLLVGDHILVFHQLADRPSWKHAYVVYGPYNDIQGVTGWKVMDPDGGVYKSHLILNDSDKFILIQR